MATPFPFTAGAVLTAAQMNSIGESVSFTPSITNLTIGNGTRTGTYVLVNKVVYFQVNITFGSTTTITGLADLTLPIAATGRVQFDTLNATVAFLDNSVPTLYAGMNTLISSTSVRLFAILTNGVNATQQDISATVPFTWAVNDKISVAGNYQVA